MKYWPVILSIAFTASPIFPETKIVSDKIYFSSSINHASSAPFSCASVFAKEANNSCVVFISFLCHLKSSIVMIFKPLSLSAADHNYKNVFQKEVKDIESITGKNISELKKFRCPFIK